MACKIISLLDSVGRKYSFENAAQSQVLLVTDEILRQNMVTLKDEERISLQRQLSESRMVLDLSQLSTKVGLQWVASLPERDLILDGEAFPFPIALDVAKEDLKMLLGKREGIALKWVEPIAPTFDAVCTLLIEGKLKRLKIQGGFAISENQFAQLKEALLKARDLVSLELSNLRLGEDQMLALAEVVPQLKHLQILTLETNGMSNMVVAPFKTMIEKCPWLFQMKFTFSRFSSLESLRDLHQSTIKGQILDLGQNWDFA